MKTRKMKSGLLSLALMGAMIVPVSANTTEVTTTVESTYTLSIPARTEIAYKATTTDLTGKLKVTGNVLPTQSVEVSAGVKALAATNASLPFELKNGTGVFTSATWSESELRTGKEIQLSVHITEDDWNNAKAGTYKGSIVFTSNIK